MAPTTIHIPCPDIVCGLPGDIIGGITGGGTGIPGVGIPGIGIPGIPSVSDVIKEALKTIVQMFTGSAQDNLKKVLSTITSTPVANLKAHAFTTTYEQVFGMVILVGILCALFNTGYVLLKNHREETPVSGWLNLGKITLFCMVFPGLVAAAIFVSQSASKGMLHYFNQTKWQHSLGTSASLGDVVSDLWLTINSFFIRMMILMEIVPIQLGIYLFTLLAILGSSLTVIRGKMGTLSRWLFAALATGIILQPFLVITLGFGGMIISWINPSETAQVYMVFFLMLVALIMPFLVFWWSNKQIKSWVENRVRVDGEVGIKHEVNVAQQRHDVQSGLNAQLGNISTSNGGTGGNGVLKDAALVGVGVAADRAVMGTAEKVAAGTHPLVGAAIVYGHHRYLKKRLPGGKGNPPPKGQ